MKTSSEIIEAIENDMQGMTDRERADLFGAISETAALASRDYDYRARNGEERHTLDAIARAFGATAGNDEPPMTYREAIDARVESIFSRKTRL